MEYKIREIEEKDNKEVLKKEDMKGKNEILENIKTEKNDIFKNETNVKVDNIPDLNNISQLRKLLNIGNLYLANDEKSLLITFIIKINSIIIFAFYYSS